MHAAIASRHFERHQGTSNCTDHHYYHRSIAQNDIRLQSSSNSPHTTLLEFRIRPRFRCKAAQNLDRNAHRCSLGPSRDQDIPQNQRRERFPFRTSQ